MEHRGVNEDSSTVSSHSQAHNSSLSQDNQNKSSFFFCFLFFFLYSSYHVPSRHIASTPEVFLFTNSINFHNSPMRQIKLLAPIR